MVLWHVGGQLVGVAPVGGLLVRDSDVRGQNLHAPHIRWQRLGGGVRTQQQDSLNSRLEAGHIELLERANWLIQYTVNHMDRAFLSIRVVCC